VFNNRHGLLRRICEVQRGYILVVYGQMPLPFTNDRWPTFTEQNQRAGINNAGLDLVPY